MPDQARAKPPSTPTKVCFIGMVTDSVKSQGSDSTDLCMSFELNPIMA